MPRPCPLAHSVRELLPPAGLRSPAALVPLAAAAALAIVFVATTGLVWEDFLISYRYAENLAHGLGLVYWPGQRVQGFTSPLNTLLPALFAWATRAGGFGIPLFLYRIVSLALLLFGVASAAAALRRSNPGASASRIAAFAFPILAVLEIKTCAFAMSGQEAGLMIGFLGGSFALAALGWSENWLLGAVLWAGLFYTRPDAIIPIGATALAAFVFEPGSRRPLLAALVRSGALAVVLYLPWVAFATWYFGSPVPHTIVAKYGTAAYHLPAFGLTAPFAIAFYWIPDVLTWTLSPVNDWLQGGPGAWPTWMHDAALILEGVAVLYWLVPTRNRHGRMASLAAFVLFCYLVYTKSVGEYAPWYFPPLSFLSLFTLASAAAHAAGLLARARSFALGAGLLAALAAFLGWQYVASLELLRFKQQIVEDGKRRQIGLWLKAHAKPGDTVYLEALGYIGYYSGCHVMDFPGLVSPEVVAARRKLGVPIEFAFAAVANDLRPRWLVARASDIANLQRYPWLARHYIVAGSFDVRDRLEQAAGNAPGLDGLLSDAQFYVLERSD